MLTSIWTGMARGASIAMLLLPIATPVAQQLPQLPQLENHADPGRLAAFAAAVRQRLPYVPGELLVQFRDGTSTIRQVSALRMLRWDAAGPRARWVGQTLLLSGLEPADMEATAALMRTEREVAFAQPNYLLSSQSVPNDAQYSRQWNMGQINMPAAWDINRTAGAGVIVAVLDSGLTTIQGAYGFRLPTTEAGPPYETFTIPFSRPPDFDFARVLPGAEFTHTGSWTVGGQPAQFDAEGHGTHVAGTVAQHTNNGIGFAGVAGGVTLLPVKVCSGPIDLIMAWGFDQAFPDAEIGCTAEDVAAGIYYAVDQGAKVINISIGGALPQPVVQAALAYATTRGAFVAVAAGNEALDGNPLSFPAVYAEQMAGVVAVGASTPTRTRAAYSNYGSYVELMAPGGEGGINGCGADSDLIWQKAPDERALFDFLRFDQYADVGLCGTSMAAPHVAGAAALLFSQGVRSPAAIEAALARSAVDLGTKGRDPDYGFGLIDVRAALIGRGLGR